MVRCVIVEIVVGLEVFCQSTVPDVVDLWVRCGGGSPLKAEFPPHVTEIQVLNITERGKKSPAEESRWECHRCWSTQGAKSLEMRFLGSVHFHTSTEIIRSELR